MKPSDAYDALVKDIEHEWPAERITQWLLNREIASYKFYRKRLEQTERENTQARVKGVSYKERQKFTREVDALELLMQESMERGASLRRDLRNKFWGHRSAGMYISPEDVEVVHRIGFEKHLLRATMGDN